MKILISSLVILLIFSSCKKKNNFDDPEVKRLLEGYDIKISYDNLDRIDTLFMDRGVMLFSYNNVGQLVKVIDTDLITFNAIETKINYENGIPKSGNLTSKINSSSKTPETVTYLDSIKFVTDNRLVSKIEYFDRIIKYFSFAPNGTYTENQPNYKSTSDITRQNGNLSIYKSGDYEYRYEYGNKKSCGFANKIDLAFINNHWKLLPVLSSNNELLKVTVFYKGALEMTEQYEYTYNTEGYPTKITAKKVFSSNNTSILAPPFEIKYEYK